MIIKYYSYIEPKRIIEVDLSKLEITGWRVQYSDGWNADMLDIFHKPDENKSHPRASGICPPVSSVINYEDVIKYLNDNFLSLKGCQ